jgi:hypothetical protein
MEFLAIGLGMEVCVSVAVNELGVTVAAICVGATVRPMIGTKKKALSLIDKSVEIENI